MSPEWGYEKNKNGPELGFLRENIKLLEVVVQALKNLSRELKGSLKCLGNGN